LSLRTRKVSPFARTDISSALSLFHLLGYNLLLVSSVLVLRALTMGSRDGKD